MIMIKISVHISNPVNKKGTMLAPGDAYKEKTLLLCELKGTSELFPSQMLEMHT